ncbi:MAG: periplasmic heavy metal sensor [Myxococcaceae bacterium]
MFGFIFGTACLIGLIKVARAGRCGGYGYAGYGGGHHFGGGGCGGRMHGGWGHGHHGGGRFGGFGRMGARGPLRFVFAKLQTTPGQEKLIAEEVENVLNVLRESRGELTNIRGAIANALRSPVFNQEALNEVQVKQDATMEKVRDAIRGSLAKIHEALDDKQRQELAAIIEGFGGFGRGPGSWV